MSDMNCEPFRNACVQCPRADGSVVCMFGPRVHRRRDEVRASEVRIVWACGHNAHLRCTYIVDPDSSDPAFWNGNALRVKAVVPLAKPKECPICKSMAPTAAGSMFMIAPVVRPDGHFAWCEHPECKCIEDPDARVDVRIHETWRGRSRVLQLLCDHCCPAVPGDSSQAILGLTRAYGSPCEE